MKSLKKLFYFYFLAGVSFLITAMSFYGTEDSNLVPVFACLGFALISIGFVVFGKNNKSKKQCSKD